MKVAYYSEDTGEVSYLLSGKDLTGFPYPDTGQLAVMVEGTAHLPGYIEGVTFHQIPFSPSPAHTWDWSTKAWVLTLDAAKGAKWAAVKAARDAREFGEFVWSGHSFDGDIQAQRRLNLAVMAAQMALQTNAPWSIDWTLADNAVMTLSASDLVAVVEALGANIDAAHEDARAKRALIEAATTVADLDAISVG
jgi:hypothetical protein